jgi:hypothetical protein
MLPRVKEETRKSCWQDILNEKYKLKYKNFIC